MLGEGRLEQIHLFVSRDKVFSEEQVLQETMIIRVKKTVNIPSHVLITSSKSNDDFNDITKLDVPYASVVTGSSLYVYLPTSEADIRVLDMINTYRYTFPDEGLRMRTGIVVDFRQWEDLRKEPGEHHLPLFYSQHIRGGKVNHNPSGKEYDWIIDSKRGLIQKTRTMFSVSDLRQRKREDGCSAAFTIRRNLSSIRLLQHRIRSIMWIGSMVKKWTSILLMAYMLCLIQPYSICTIEF